MSVLEFGSITAESKGYMVPGKLKMTDTNIIFKNDKTGKVEQVNASDIELINFQKFVGHFGLRIFMKNGQLHRYSGFTGDEEKIATFVKKNYELDMLEKELSMRGWNWGTVHFTGSVLSFDVEKKTNFEIPLQHVSQCTTGKNEVILEFHQNDDAPVSLMEMRFHIPITENDEADPVEAFHQNVMQKASVISASGEAIATFREIHCLTPRGRYDIKVFQTFFQLHGKTFDYKIATSTVLRLFLLPHKDSRQMFFVMSLDPPIKQGQTRYHYLVLLFSVEDEITIELPFDDAEIKEKYEDKLTKEITGPVYEVFGKIMKVVLQRKLTGPGTFVGHSGTPAVGCSYKAAAGYLYPLERGFIYIHKPPLHIRFEEIASVNFARSGGSTKSFDFEIELKSGTVNTFSSIEKEEYNRLYDFISSKKLHVKNTGKDKQSYKDDFGDSDNEKEPDAYLERVKAEAKERDDSAGSGSGGDSEESTDEDFNPNQAESDVAEEYDSNVATSDSDAESGASGGGSDTEKKKKKENKTEKKEKSKPKSSGGGEKSSKKKKSKEVDANKPKRPNTAFMIWLGEMRDQIKKENPGISITEVAKKGGELWRAMNDKSEWENKAAKEKEKYTEAMKNYVPSGESPSKSSVKRKKPSSSAAGSGGGTGGAYKSKEYISDDDSSSESAKSGDEKKKKPKKGGSGSEDDKPKKATKEKLKKKKKASDDESGSDKKDDSDADTSSDGSADSD